MVHEKPIFLSTPENCTLTNSPNSYWYIGRVVKKSFFFFFFFSPLHPVSPFLKTLLIVTIDL